MESNDLETAIHHVQKLTLAVAIGRGVETAAMNAEAWLESIGRMDLDYESQ